MTGHGLKPLLANEGGREPKKMQSVWKAGANQVVANRQAVSSISIATESFR
jgi:hypothetical protein